MTEPFKAELDHLVKRCTELLMAFQRKEQLPRKFVDSDREELSEFESRVADLMSGCGSPGELFIKEWSSPQFQVQETESRINTRELKRRLKLLAQFQREFQESTRSD